MFKYLAAISLVAAKGGRKANKASKVCVNNDAGFVMNYKLVDLASGTESPETGKFPINQHICRDLGEVVPDIEEGDILEISVHAVAGLTKNADTPLKYSADAGTLIYKCTGATLTYSCKLENPEDSSKLAELNDDDQE